MTYEIKVDLHTHTVFSGHGYGTIEENLREAARMNLEALAITDHLGGGFLDIDPTDPNFLFKKLGHFLNTNALPKVWHGVKLLNGVEVDIDEKGNLFGYDIEIKDDSYQTLNKKILSKCDIVIASIHRAPGGWSENKLMNTKMYSKVLENPDVLIIGHPGRALVPFELDTVLGIAKEQGKIIEINEHSYDTTKEVHDACRKIAIRCAELGVNIAVGSDAHCSYYVGKFPRAISMLEEINFPSELIANVNLERLNHVIQKSQYKNIT
ncbi:MAG: PHP domain-containing protein [Anaerocolumna sp.]